MRFQVDRLKVEIHADSESCGQAAASAAAESLAALSRDRDCIGVVFATGASQLDMLRALVARRGIPWPKILGFHLDEYVGIAERHPASFRNYLRQQLTSQVNMRGFYEIDGNARDIHEFCRDYALKLHQAAPQLCLLGIGENGHLAFNEPGEADFNDPLEVKVVRLDAVCREQQAAEGWFPSAEEVPECAITLTIPTLFRIPQLLISAPGARKAQIIGRVLREPVVEACPATILRTHPNATLFLDSQSAAKLDLREAALSVE